MSRMLSPGETVQLQTSGVLCVVEEHLGGGGQGEVYRCTADGKPIALKWYHAHYLAGAPRLRDRIENAIREGPPSDRFLWPLDLAIAPGLEFGYVMPLREKRFRGIIEWMKRRIRMSFYALATAGFELADSFLLLHAKKGLCYRDISFGNAFFDPDGGEIRICDNDNVDFNGQPGEIGGTPAFMAPEIVRGEAMPSIESDRHSLAVLLFYLFLTHHPLEGAREAAIRCMDEPARRKLYGLEPVFIFDPQDESNRPVPEFHPLPIAFWPIYPKSLRDLFTRAFTTGLRDPTNGRVGESEWRSAMIKLRDSIMHCPGCQGENFYDPDALRQAGGRPPACWNCGQEATLPFRVRIDKTVVLLNRGTRLFHHHVDPQRMYDFSGAVAEVTQHPTQPDVLGLKNVGGQKWTFQGPDHVVKEVAPGMNCRLVSGATVNFGTASGEIRR